MVPAMGLRSPSIGDDSQSFDESDIQLSTDNLDSGNLGDVVQAAIVIGPGTIDEGTMGNIAFTVYRDDALFVMDGQVGSNDGRRNITVNTNIIGASLGTSETRPLNAPVTITLAHKQVKYKSHHKLVCRFYLLNG